MGGVSLALPCTLSSIGSISGAAARSRAAVGAGAQSWPSPTDALDPQAARAQSPHLQHTQAPAAPEPLVVKSGKGKSKAAKAGKKVSNESSFEPSASASAAAAGGGASTPTLRPQEGEGAADGGVGADGGSSEDVAQLRGELERMRKELAKAKDEVAEAETKLERASSRERQVLRCWLYCYKSRKAEHGSEGGDGVRMLTYADVC